MLPHGFFQKKGPFSNFFFLGNIGQENVFYEILERTNAFLGYKNKKSGKINIFSKGLTHSFGPKMVIFLTFFLRNIGQKECLLQYSRTKNAFLGCKNSKFKKSNRG